ncbi:putative leucine-rich repeat-containing protein DDB_G0290503 [Calliphora vicina]|uniref:putative leucine-rich repeat-containing protein DDB_G0290503 n=1 Tax=Calliphora vicina TaxID=7373 RepID=UPI00325C250A
MGRFKIYDPKKVVKILNDNNYAKCLLCEKKLKNVMGNIKRHYEQIHNIKLDANSNKKRSKRKSRRYKEEDEAKLPLTPDENKRTASLIIKIDKNENSYALAKPDNTNIIPTSLKGRKNSGFNSNTITNTSKEVQLNEISLKPKSVSQDKVLNNSKTVIVANTTEEEVEINSLIEGVLISRKNKSKLQNDKPIIEEQLPENNPTHKKIKLNDKNNEIPNTNTELQRDTNYNSYINNVQMTSMDSCHQDELLKCVVEIKAELNIPLRNFQEGNTFQVALESSKQNVKLQYSSQTIGEHMDKMDRQLRQKITEIVANRLIYLKLDIASNKESNLMLINIQFIKDFEIKVFTLRALELQNDHLATYLKEKVLETLESYKIDISRVYSITKDNANNIKESLKLKEDNTENSTIKKERDDEANVHTLTSEYCQHLCEQFPGHAIHFVACDIIKQLNENISQSRDSAKSLFLQMSQLNIKPLPMLDNNISWFSIYDMIKSLLNVREKIESNSSLLVEVDWNFATKFEESFRPIVDIALMLQSNNHFIMGDLYREWLLCEIELEELSVSNELALYLLEAMGNRKRDLFKNTTFLAALYLDPRFCYIATMHLNDQQKEMAVTQLLQIFNKLKRIQENENIVTSCSKHSDRYTKLENNIAATSNMATISTNHLATLNNVDCQWVREALESLQFEERLPFNTNILDYWKMAKYKNPILAKIAEIALAAPATQATINRVIHAWSITLMKRNNNISSDNIETILLLKLNQDLVDKISLGK